jgi:lipopolysaccharide/colanic/teichoic acid biosynthesis glycosyltransferase
MATESKQIVGLDNQMGFFNGETSVMNASNGKRQGGRSTHEHSKISAYFARKAWPSRILAVLLLVPAGPVIVLLAIVTRLTSPGPGLFAQERTGRNGNTFSMYKIRTMYKDAEAVSGPVWCAPGDSRITPLGRILRLLHLDELPQLINVARGEMDLVGPRPERPIFVAKLAREVPNYVERLQILPGVTGLAQVNLPPDESTDCVRRKLALDCAYIHEASAGLDFRILLCTFLRMLGLRHGRAVRWLRLERPVPEFRPVRQAPKEYEADCPQYAVVEAAAEAHANGHVSGAPAIAEASENEDSCYAMALQESTIAAGSPPRRPK